MEQWARARESSAAGVAHWAPPGESPQGASWPRVWAQLIVLGLLALGWSALAPAASAHATARPFAVPAPQLSVADGAILEGPPENLILTFATPVRKGFEVTFVHETQHGILLPELAIAGGTVTQPLPNPMVRGTYFVEWRGQSESGESIAGQSKFTLKKGVAWPSSGPAPVPTVSTRPVPVVPSDPAASPATSSGSIAPSATGATNASAPASGGGMTATGWILAGALLVILAVGAFVVSRLRASRR